MGHAKTILSLSLVAAFLFTACVKDPQDIPASITENPAFTIAGTFGSEQIDIKAGTEGWTMQPVIEEGDSTRVYSAIFSKDGCLDACSPSLEFKFYSPVGTNTAVSSDFQETVFAGEKEFVLSGTERSSFEILLQTHPGLFMSGYSLWDDLNNPGSNFEAQYASTLDTGEALNVCFHSVGFSGCQYSQCIYFDPSTLIPCIAHIVPTMESSRYISLRAVPKGTPPFTYRWFNYDSSATILLPVVDSVAEVYAGVTITDALGNRSEISQIIRIQNMNVDPCYFPITLSSIPIENTNASFFASKVEIIYRDSDGVEWKSIDGAQPTTSSLYIQAVSYFDQFLNTLPAYKTQLNFQVELFDNTGKSRTMAAENGVIALAHRE